MDSPPELYELQTVEQLRAIADPLRLRIVDTLADQPMTATQVGDALGVPANKIHYHVRELERVGLARIVETREKGGILEKYYQAAGRSLNVPPTLLQSAPPDESIAAAREVLQSVMQGFLQAFSHAARHQAWGDYAINLDYTDLWVTADEWKDVEKKVKAVLKPYQGRANADGRRQLAFLLLTHPAAPAAGVDAETAPDEPQPSSFGFRPGDLGHPQQTKGLIIEAPGKAGSTKPHRIVTVGAIGYSRSELERIVQSGRQLDLNVLGYLTFAADVGAELADAAILRVRHRGVLNAAPAVKAVLKRKGAKVPE